MVQKYNCRVVLVLLGFGLASASCGLQTTKKKEDGWRCYTVYKPTIEYSTVYQAGSGAIKTLYNHCSSIEWFDGRFWVVWQGNRSNHEGCPGQVLYISYSENGLNWSTPETFTGPGHKSFPMSVSIVPKQPNLVKVNNQLWCVWHAWGGGTTSIRIARLEKGATSWVDQEIQSWILRNGKKYFGYTSQDPVVLKSGRVAIPAVYIEKDPENKRYPARFAAITYSDDNGETWSESNPVDFPGDHNAVWEPCVYEQADGILRMLVRNLSRSRNKDPQKNLLTTTGTGSQKDSPMVFEQDLKYMRIETITERPSVLNPVQEGGHYIMIHHDLVADEVVYANRENISLFFSRSGSDDFVAGTSLTPRGEVASYAQGVLHGNALYVSYTRGLTYEPRSIQVAKVSPLPDPSAYYIFPRRKDVLDMERCDAPVFWERKNVNYSYDVPSLISERGRPTVLFTERGTAGVDTDVVDLFHGDQLEVMFSFDVRKLPYRGNLILCTFGDKIPVRIGIPSNRPNQLYVESAEGWVHAFDLEVISSTNSLMLCFGEESFSVALNDGEKKIFRNPSVNMAPRLYLGDGYETDFTESNRGSEFRIELNSFKTRVVRKQSGL